MAELISTNESKNIHEIYRKEVEKTVRSISKNISRFALQRSTGQSIYVNPSLLFSFPRIEPMVQEFPELPGHKTQAGKQILNQLVQNCAQDLEIYSIPNAQIAPPEHDLVFFGPLPKTLSPEYENVTAQLRFQIATIGSIYFYYESEYLVTKQQIRNVSQKLRQPKEFEAYIDSGDWDSPITLWVKWYRLKMINDQVIKEITYIINHSLLKLETLHYVQQYLKQPLKESEIEGLSEKEISNAKESRKSISSTLDRIADHLAEANDLDAAKVAIAALSALSMLEFLFPPVPEEVILYSERIMTLVQDLETEMVEPCLDILEEEKVIDERINTICNTYINRSPKAKAIPDGYSIVHSS